MQLNKFMLEQKQLSVLRNSKMTKICSKLELGYCYETGSMIYSKSLTKHVKPKHKKPKTLCPALRNCIKFKKKIPMTKQLDLTSTFYLPLSFYDFYDTNLLLELEFLKMQLSKFFPFERDQIYLAARDQNFKIKESIPSSIPFTVVSLALVHNNASISTALSRRA